MEKHKNSPEQYEGREATTNVNVDVKSGGGFQSGLSFGFGCIAAGIIFFVVVLLMCRLTMG